MYRISNKNKWESTFRCMHVCVWACVSVCMLCTHIHTYPLVAFFTNYVKYISKTSKCISYIISNKNVEESVFLLACEWGHDSLISLHTYPNAQKRRGNKGDGCKGEGDLVCVDLILDMVVFPRMYTIANVISYKWLLFGPDNVMRSLFRVFYCQNNYCPSTTGMRWVKYLSECCK